MNDSPTTYLEWLDWAHNFYDGPVPTHLMDEARRRFANQPREEADNGERSGNP